MAEQAGKIVIRKLVKSDLEKVIDIDLSIHGKARMPTWPFSFESYWDIYRPDIAFAAELDDEVVGFIVGNIVQDEHKSVSDLRHSGEPSLHHRWIGWMDMIGIRPEHYHKGIGRGLVEAFYQECQRHNVVMRSIAYNTDEGLKNFLENMGFTKSDVIVYEKGK